MSIFSNADFTRVAGALWQFLYPSPSKKKLYWLDYGVSSPAKHSERSRNYAGHASKLCDEQ